jgi:hypothetical protein
MRGMKAVTSIQEDLLKNVPWVTLEARGRSAGRGYTWRITAAGITYWDTEATNPAHRDGTSFSSPDIPVRVLADFQRQLAKVKQNTEGFSKSAVEHLAPGLVIRALDGEHVSWQKSLITEIVKLHQEINKTLTVAGNNIPAEMYMFNTIKLSWQGIIMGTMEISKNNVAWSGSQLSMYMVLPQVLQEVNRWIAIMQAVHDAYEKGG